MINPMFAMILMTILYGVYTALSRVKAAKNRELDVRYFKTMSGYEVPKNIEITTRHFGNLLETPPLFYVAGALIIAMGLESTATIALGWIYVLFRAAHMYIHNTYNYPIHRLMVFAGGLVCILALWIILVISL